MASSVIPLDGLPHRYLQVHQCLLFGNVSYEVKKKLINRLMNFLGKKKQIDEVTFNKMKITILIEHIILIAKKKLF